MIVTMQPGIGPDDERVRAVIRKADMYGLSPDVRHEQGTHHAITQIYLLDGAKVRSCSVADHLFRVVPGVDSVQRVTPPKVSIAHGVNGDHHRVRIDGVDVGTGLPCRLVMGPCTVDKYVDRIIETLVGQGIRLVRGGCWKPRSSPHSFPGFGEAALKRLLVAARRHGAAAVFTEVIESEHIEAVRRARRESKFEGTIVLWVGARTSNTVLLRALGAQREFPVMLKNGVEALGVGDLYERAEWVLAGGTRWRSDGSLEKSGMRAGNDQLILCLRGTRQTDPRSPWRFVPNHSWAEILQSQCWAPVAIDPSHSAGTMEHDLVFRNVEEALRYRPSLLMVEGGYPVVGFRDGFRGFCDQAQSVPIEQVPTILRMVRTHNQTLYGQLVS